MYSFYLPGYLKSLWKKKIHPLIILYFCYIIGFVFFFTSAHVFISTIYFCSDGSFIVPIYCDQNSFPSYTANLELISGDLGDTKARLPTFSKFLGYLMFFPFVFAGNLMNIVFTFFWFSFFLLRLLIIKLPVFLPDEELVNAPSQMDRFAQKIGPYFEWGFALLGLISLLFVFTYGSVTLSGVEAREEIPFFASWAVVSLILFIPLAPIFMTQATVLRFRSNDLNDLIQEKFSSNKDVMDSEESLVLEFKTSFQTSYPNKAQQLTDKEGKIYYTLDNKRQFKSEKEIEKLLQSMVLESVVGFLNSIGGQLVIGINEKDNVKKIVGIEYEGFASEDEYERHVIQQIINRIGKNFLGDYIQTSFEKVEDKTLFILNIKAFIPKNGQIPALLDGTKCFKRTGARTDPINEGAEFANFVATRIKN